MLRILTLLKNWRLMRQPDFIEEMQSPEDWRQIAVLYEFPVQPVLTDPWDRSLPNT